MQCTIWKRSFVVKDTQYMFISKANRGACTYILFRHKIAQTLHNLWGKTKTNEKSFLEKPFLVYFLNKISFYTTKQELVYATLRQKKDFVPHYMGFDHFTQNKIIDKQPLYLLWNFLHLEIQILQYCCWMEHKVYAHSMCKGRFLVKPTMIVAFHGYLIDILGPYLADGRK